MKRPGEQLKMFMTPDEITNHVTGSVDAPHRDPAMRKTLMQSMLDGKLAVASQPRRDGQQTLAENIRAEGIQHPVVLSKQMSNYRMDDDTWMGNGNHRLAVAQDIQRQTGKPYYVPVIHHDENFMGPDGDTEYKHF